MRDIKPTHKLIKTFYAELKQYENLGATSVSGKPQARLAPYPVCSRILGIR